MSRFFKMRTLLTVGLVLLVAWFGAAWFASEQVRTEIIQLQDYEPYQLTTVVGTDFKEIILTNSDIGATELAWEEYAGVVWDGGFGQITDYLGSDGRTVRRTFTVLEGSEPAEGERVNIDEYYWPNDPSALGLDYREYEIEGPLGPLPVWEYPAGDDGPWAILVHGRQARGLHEMLRYVGFLNEEGFNVLIPSYRNDEGAPQVEDRQVGFGLTEWEDLQAVVDHVVGLHGTDVTVMGQSMGGAITLSWMINDPTTANQIRAVVLDSPAVDVAEVVRFGAEDISWQWREFEVGPPPLLVDATLLVSRLRHSFDWAAMDYTQQTADLPDTPILVVHGVGDATVPIESAREFANNAVTARLLEYPAGGHTRLWNVDPTRYRDDVIQFLDLHAP